MVFPCRAPIGRREDNRPQPACHRTAPNKTEQPGGPAGMRLIAARFDGNSAMRRGVMPMRAQRTETYMAIPLIIRIGATTEFGPIVAGNTGWFPDYLPIAGSPAAEAIVVIGTAVLLHELVEFAHEIGRKLRAWRRRTGARPPGSR
jgi:hypothetical protein